MRKFWDAAAYRRVGKLGEREVDFIATRQNEKIYIQVAYLLGSAETIEREFGVFKSIPDNYPKYVLTLDDVFGEGVEGIHRINLIDFLLSDFQTTQLQYTDRYRLVEKTARLKNITTPLYRQGVAVC